MHSAIYSIIQYCPVRVRQEAVNVGVVIVCPELGTVRARFSSNNERVRRLFGDEAFDDIRLSMFKDALQSRLSKLSGDEQEFRQWLGSEAGQFRFTGPQPMLVRDLDRDLAELFQRCVGELQPVRTQPQPPKELSVEVFTAKFKEHSLYRGNMRGSTLHYVPIKSEDLGESTRESEYYEAPVRLENKMRVFSAKPSLPN